MTGKPESKVEVAKRNGRHRWATERLAGEGLGDFYQRIIGHASPRVAVTGREQSTFELMQLGVAP